MAHTINTFTYSGDTEFDLAFSSGYQTRADVTAYKVGTPKVPVAFDWIGDYRVRIVPDGLEAGDTIVFTRTVSKINLPLDLLQPSNFTREGIIAAATHTLRALQEVLDGRVDSFTGEFVDFMNEYVRQTQELLDQATDAKNDVEALADSVLNNEFFQSLDGYINTFQQIQDDSESAVTLSSASADRAELAAQAAEVAVGTLNKQFDSKEDLAAAYFQLSEGETASVKGVDYVKKASATGMDSALYDIGVDGFIAPGYPNNLHFGTFFKNEKNWADLVTSQDLKRLIQVNSAPIVAGADQNLLGFDPSMWYDEERDRFVILSWGASADLYAFVSDDLITWQRFYRSMGPTQIKSGTVPVSGGTVPADTVWGMGYVEHNGELYALALIRMFENFTDDEGRNIRNMQLHYARCNNRENMTFDAPVHIPLRNDISMIGNFIVKEGNTWYMFTKNDKTKNIECWTSTTGPLSGWTYSYTLDYAQNVEGCCVVPEYYYPLGSSKLSRRWHLLTDAYHSSNYWGKTATSLSSAAGWSSEYLIKGSRTFRHGNLYNFAYNQQAAKVISRAMSYYSNSDVPPMTWKRIFSGAHVLSAQDDTIYYVADDDYAEITLEYGAARTAHFVVLSDDPKAGIELKDGDFFAARNGVSDFIGASHRRAVVSLHFNGYKYTVPNIGIPGVGNWVAFGDSNTYRTAPNAESWANLLGPIVSDRFFNYAVGGATSVGTTSENSLAAQFQVAQGPILQSADLITIMMGTNDALQGKPMGTLGANNTANFYGSLRVAFNNCQNASPGARVIFMTPLYAGNGVDATVEPYREAIRNFCAEYNLELIDTAKICGFNDLNHASMYADDVHPLQVGHTKIANIVKGYLT